MGRPTYEAPALQSRVDTHKHTQTKTNTHRCGWVGVEAHLDAVAQLHQLRVEGGGRPLNGQDVNAERVEWERTHDAFFGTLQVERHVVNESRYRIRRLQQISRAGYPWSLPPGCRAFLPSMESRLLHGSVSGCEPLHCSPPLVRCRNVASARAGNLPCLSWRWQCLEGYDEGRHDESIIIRASVCGLRNNPIF